MQHHSSAGIAQRLLHEKSFREAVRTAFSGSQPSDLLQRCRALNACIQQGHAPQPVQQEASSSDSDICSECSTLDSDISDNREVGTSKSAAANGTTAHTDSFARRQPTLVQHAAAATIQRRFRQQLHTRRQGCTRNMQPRPDQNQISINSTVKTLAEAHTQQQHEAASCIQAWWRRQCAIRRVQMAAPPTPPCSNMQTGCNSMHSSRPDSASSISQSELDAHTSEEEYATNLAVQAFPGSASLAKLRVSSTVQRKRAHALPACYPAPNTAAMLVVQRTTDRAQQVQDMEKQKWLIAQVKF